MSEQGQGESEWASSRPANLDQLLRSVEEAMADLEFGSILITVHAAKVVQVEVTRKRRFDP